MPEPRPGRTPKTSAARWLGTSDPFARLKRIEALELPGDYREITQLFYADFQSAMVAKSLNGFMMNFASPRISRVLDATGELEQRVAKRVVDTIMLASTVMEHGYAGPGRDAARRVNAMHSHYDIHSDDFLAVGAEEVVDSIALGERYGWRPVTGKEREAVNLYYSRQTRAFGSPNPLPATYAETKAFYDAYLERQVRYEPQNARLAQRLIAWLPTLAPAPARPLFRMILLGQLDARLARACGLRPPSPPARWLARVALRRMGCKDPVPDGGPNPLEALIRRVYPHGAGIGELGTHLHGPRPTRGTNPPLEAAATAVR